jgi:hypothetical protein
MIRNIILALISISFFGFSLVQDFKLNIQVIKDSFPYNNLKEYRITDTLLKSAYVDDDLFLDLFQHFTTKPPIDRGECGCPIRTQVFKSNEYLLSYHGELKNDNNSKYGFDFLTVLVEKPDTSRIYWLSYAHNDFNDSMMINFHKGQLSNVYLDPVLAEKYGNDSIELESYSTFLDSLIIKKTTIINHKKTNLYDSTIQIMRLVLYDMSVILDETRFENDSCTMDYMGAELRNKLNY